MKILARSLVVAALVLSPSLAAAQAPPPAPPTAAAIEEGKAHFLRGVSLFQENDFRSALVEFRRSYELSHNYKVLYNTAQTDYELQDYAGALRAFRRYLAEGGNEIDAARRASVEEDVKKLLLRVARVEIKANVEGAEVLVDDVSVGKTPLKEPVLVSMGRRKVVIQKGGVTASRTLELAGGDQTSVSLDLAEPAPTTAGPTASPAFPAPPPPTFPQQPAPAPSRTGLWASVGVTGALTVGAVVTGVFALQSYNDTESKLGMLGVKASDVQSAHGKTVALAATTDVLGGLAIVMAGVSIGLGVTGGKSSGEAPKAAITVGPRGGAVSLRF